MTSRSARIGPVAASMMVTSMAFLLAGVLWPHLAETLLRMLLLVLAIGFVGARAWRVSLPEGTTMDSYSPFDGGSAARESPVEPTLLRELTARLADAGDPGLAQRTVIPWDVARTLVEEASRRLSDHHGLRLDDPADHGGIRALVSEPTWLLVDPDGGDPLDGARPIPLSRLDLILDDVERL